MFHTQVHLKFSDIVWIMFGNGFKCMYANVSCCVSILLNFHALSDAHNIMKCYSKVTEILFEITS